MMLFLSCVRFRTAPFRALSFGLFVAVLMLFVDADVLGEGIAQLDRPLEAADLRQRLLFPFAGGQLPHPFAVILQDVFPGTRFWNWAHQKPPVTRQTLP